MASDPKFPFDNKSVYQEAFDQPAYEGERKYYLICCAPRVGSWLLCSLLSTSGVLGVPAEYFNTHVGMRQTAERFGLLYNEKVDLGQYIEALKGVRTTPNGVFGFKTQFFQAKPLIQGRLISKHFPDVKFIYLSRRDLIAQGVSYEIARQTEKWSSVDDGPAAVYDENRILNAINFITGERTSWENFFALNDIDPLRIDYKSLIEQPRAICLAISTCVGVETDYAFGLETSSMTQQRDGLNAEWIARIKTLGRF